MSILTELLRNLSGGKMSPAEAWTEASGKVEADVGKIMAKGPPIAQEAAQAIAPVVKQGLSDVIALADTALGDILPQAADAVATAFTTAATAYLGPVVAGSLSPVARDGIYKVRDMLIHGINAEALALEAQLTAGTPAAPPASAGTQA